MIAVAVLILVLAALAAVLVTRRSVARIELINATSRAIMMSGLDSASRCAAPMTNGMAWPRIST